MGKYFTAKEVAEHNSEDDCWVSIFDNVFDISNLLLENRGPLAQPLIEAAGTSISHWFDQKTNNVKTFVDPTMNIIVPYTPSGRFVHVPPPYPVADLPSIEKPWWQDSNYIVGKLTKKTRVIKVMNMLTRTEDIINTCEEETVGEIRERYMTFNQHSGSYTWKALIEGEFKDLDLLKTLQGNEVPDESDNFAKLGLDDDFYMPTLHIYFDDDLTYA